MERTSRLQVPVAPAELKALKLLALDRGLSMAQLVRAAIDAHYGDTLRDPSFRLPSVSANAQKRVQKKAGQS